MPATEQLRPTPLPPGPCIMVIFGASGDLTKRKPLPSLYYLAQGKLLPQHFAVVGTASTEMTSEAFRAKIKSEIASFLEEPLDDAVWNRVEECLYYVTGSFDDAAAYQRLRDLLG